MKIIIPASGNGQRFKDAGYAEFKPLIPVVGSKKIIDYVIDCFDVNNDEFFFISSPESYEDLEDHLSSIENLKYKHLVYSGQKLGPVGAICGVRDELEKYINGTDPVIISYCDYGMKWDYSDFLKFAKETNADGIIPCYSGYHPHLENPDNVYAACKVDEDDRIYEVKEKYQSKKRHSELWSPGLYYFSTFYKMWIAFSSLVSSGKKLNGEYYASLAYNEISDYYTCKVYRKVEKFYQFGTPVDFEYAKSKLNALEELRNTYAEIKNTIILSAGKGERFLNLGFKQPKPFIPLGESDFITEITKSFDELKTEIRYVGSKEHSHFWNGYNVSLITPNKIGAAFSYSEACKDVVGETLIVPCDLIAKYTVPEFIELKKTADVIIFTSEPSQFARQNKNSFAWVSGETNGSIKSISIKELNEVLTDQMVLIGSFWVRNNQDLLDSIDEIFQKQIKTNGEFYLDNAFKNILDKNQLMVKYVKLDKYFSLGTPSEWTENQYWITK